MSNNSSASRQKIRRLFSKDQENSRLYIESKSKICKHYKLQDQLESLEQPLKESEEVPACNTDAISVMSNQIDKRLTNISLEAERAIKPRGPFKMMCRCNQMLESLCRS